MISIRSDGHHLYTYKAEKLALSACDVKRYILNNGINKIENGQTKLKEEHECIWYDQIQNNMKMYFQVYMIIYAHDLCTFYAHFMHIIYAHDLCTWYNCNF